MFDAILGYFFPKMLLTGKMISTAYNSSLGKHEMLLYSPYAEYEYTSSDTNLFIRFVITFGFERLPPDDTFLYTPKPKLREWARDGLIPWVGEIYFVNKSDDPIKLDILSISLNGQIFKADTNLEIYPKEVFLSPPFVKLGFNFATEVEIGLSFIYIQNTVEICGVAKRLTVDEVKLKYARN